MSKKLVLIDGHSIINRAFYGVPDLTNSAGLHTNGIYGFINILFRFLDEENPDYLVVAFDEHAPTFRHEMYEAYKGTRKGMPEELRQQVPVLKELLTAMDVVCISHAGWEADDILGSLAKKAESEGMEVSLVSGDRDLLQIASEKICVRIPKTKSGKTTVENYYAKDVLEAYQVTPQQFIELKALMGDTADNIPGVPKVGEKTAKELMVTFGSIEGIYEHLDEISKKSVKESLAEHRDLADLSLKLATIKTDCDLGVDWESAKAEGYYTAAAFEMMKTLEFKNLLGRFEDGVKSEKDTPVEVMTLTSLDAFSDLLKKGSGDTPLALVLAKEDTSLYGAACSTFVEGKEIHAFYKPSAQEEASFAELLKSVSAQDESVLITFDVKKQYDFFTGKVGAEGYFDVLLAAYVLNPLKNDYDIPSIALEYLGKDLKNWKDIFGKMTLSEALMLRLEEVSTYYAEASAVCLRVYETMRNRLIETEQMVLYEEIEMPLTYVLYSMEKEGVLVRREELAAYGEKLQVRIEELEKSIKEQAGCDFNINSPKQLGEILFDRMKLPGGKKTKTGYSTAADVLDKLAGEYPFVKDVLEYRGLTKLKSTYADGLAAFINEDGRIHTSFNQTITATGRISSTEPNLQNIPIRTDIGRELRKIFVPKEGYVFIDADYSQIELRLLASMSGDAQLIEAYAMSEDIHRITASKVFHIPFDQVTDLQRRNAKAVNFGIVYGISSFGLSQDLSISKKEAAEYIEQYFATYPGIKEFLDKCVSDAKENGYTKTLFGRRRPIPELSSSNFMQRSFGERVAMNAPIQGTAADIMKIAMISIFKEMQEKGCKSRLILQVHDEVLVETLPEEMDTIKELVERNMKEAADLAVTLEVGMETGCNWYEAH